MPWIVLTGVLQLINRRGVVVLFLGDQAQMILGGPIVGIEAQGLFEHRL
jgi:hypothetical protein